MKNSAEIFFSIVVPTCDRAELLNEVLMGLLQLDYSNYEIVVSNNNSSDNTEAVVTALQEVSIIPLKYVRTSTRIDLPSHWEFAVSHAKGDYVIMCGDDDFLAPDILRLVNQVINRENSDLVCWRAGLYYHKNWYFNRQVSNISQKGNVLQGGFKVTEGVYEMDRNRMVADFCNFKFFYCPNVINFTFRRSLALKIKDETGRFFWPTSPDYSAPLLLILNSHKINFIDVYGGFGGRSLNSNYHSILTREKKGRMSEFLEEFGSNADFFPFHEPKLPAYWNYLIAPVALARHFYPEKLGDNKIELTKFAKMIYSEVYSAYERISQWEDQSLIDAWRGYFRTCGMTNQQLDAIAADAIKEYDYQMGKGNSTPPLMMKDLDDAGISGVSELIRRFSEIKPFLTVLRSNLKELGDNPLFEYRYHLDDEAALRAI